MLKQSRFWYYVVLAAIVCLAAAARLYQIEIRPLHFDEGVNFHFIQKILSTGYFPYSHKNFHGPLFFYISAIYIHLWGESELLLRSSAITAGLLLIAALLPLRRCTGMLFVTLSALLITLSPSMVFISRYAIHESLFLLCTLCLAVSLLLWLLRDSTAAVYAAVLAATLLICTKETFIITFACLFLAALATDPQAVFSRLRSDWKHLTLSVLLAVLVITFIFSGGFQNATGIDELLRAIPKWTSRATSSAEHTKPFLYYIRRVIWITEWQLCIAVVCAILYSLFQLRGASRSESPPKEGDVFRSAPSRFFLTWLVAILAIYSTINYKTPWLATNAVLPALLLVAWWFSELLRSPQVISRRISLLLLLGFLASSLHNTVFYNYKGITLISSESAPYGKKNPYSYAHTTDGMLELVDLVKNYAAQHPKSKILVAVRHSWPLPYYFRSIRKGRLSYRTVRDLDTDTKRFDVIIAERNVKLPSEQWDMRSLRLSRVQRSNIFFKKK